ncbi:hypothetical protein ACQP3C_27465, partial [Escherichia coli]
GDRRTRRREGEGNGGLDGAERLSQGKNRGEQEKRNHNGWSHHRFKEKPGTREMSRDLQG